jgi:Tfp pilus assembly protein PilX
MHTTNNCQTRGRRKTDKGAILMVVLIVMIALLGLGMTGLFLTSGSIQMNTNINLRNQALVVAEAGIERARGVLNNQTTGWVPPIPTLLLGSTTSADEVPTNVADCQGAKRGAILVDQITSGCATSPTPANCTLQNVPYPSLDRLADLPTSAGPVARSTMGKYTVFIRQDQADCRMGNYTCEYAAAGTGGADAGAGAGGGGGTSGATTCTVPTGVPAPNGSIVVRSEGVASDGRTRVVLEVTMTPSQGTAQATPTPMSALCAAGANGCDDNSSVQNGIVVNSNVAQNAPPSYGGATSSGGAPGTGGATGDGGAGGVVTMPTGPTGGSPSTGGATGTGGAGTGGAGGTGGTGGSTCPENACLKIATMGITGVWNYRWNNHPPAGYSADGNQFFGAWLKANASLCAVQNIDITTTPLTTPGLLDNVKILVVLDLCHTQAAKDAYIAAKGARMAAGDNTNVEYWCDQRHLDPSEADVVVNWVSNGGRLSTTIGVHNIGYQNGNTGIAGAGEWYREAYNVNMFIRPFGITYSTIYTPPATVGGTPASNEVRIFSGGNVVVPYTSFTNTLYGPLAPSAIVDGPFGKLNKSPSQVVVNAACRIEGYPNNGYPAQPSDSATLSKYAIQSNTVLGAAKIVNNGKINVWADEWITYDDIWSRPNDADIYWKNVLDWFQKGCTP